MTKRKSQINTDERYQWGDDIPLATPFVIYLEPSGYCNLRCKFCPYARHSKELSRSIMSLELFRKIVEDVKQFPDKLKMLRVCGNGETLLNPNIIDMLQYAKEQGITNKTQLISNGTLLKPNHISDAPKYADMIVISIEGLSGEDYKNITGVKIDYTKFLSNIKELYDSCSANNCVLHLKITDMAVKDMAARELFFDTFEDRCHEINTEKMVPLFPDMEYECQEGSFRFNDDEEVKKRVVCPQIFKSLQISADGDVVPCCVDWKRVNLLGNVNSTSVVDMWNGSELRKLQNIHLAGNRFNIPLCNNCVMNEYSEIDNIDHMKGHSV